MTKIVVFRPENCSPPRAAKATLNLDAYPWRIIFSPGNNSVSDENIAKLQEHLDFGRYQTLGALTIKDAVETVASDSTTAPDNLSHLNTDEAEDLIDETSNVELLQKWLKAETRKTTRADLDRRIAALTEV